MQRQHQEKVQFPKTATSDTGFRLFQPSTISTNTRLKNPSQLSRNMGIGSETEKSSHRVPQHVQQHVQQQQDSGLGTERLTSLHAKLHQEADKIRKWKIQIEMDIKNKDIELSEANTTIESLRKSILELQLENENLSTKLQEELTNREEVLQRIQNTRDLISLLKEQEERLEDKLASCETERTELKYLEKEHAQQFEEMTAKFKTLQMEAKHDAQELIKQVQQEQVVKKNLEKELETKIAQSDHQVNLLTNKIDEKDIALREVHVMLQKNEEKLHATDKDLGAAQQQISNLSAGLTSTQEHLEKFKSECALLQGEKEQLATQLVEERERADSAKRQEDSVQEALNNSVAIFNQRHGDVQRERDLIKAELFDEQKRLKEARAQLTESLAFNESLKSSRDVLLLEKTEMELCLERLKVELTELQTEKYKNKSEISSLEAEIESLQSHLQQEQRAASKLQVQVDEINPRYASLEKEKKLLQQELNNLKETISTQKSDLQKALEAQREDGKHTQHLQDAVTQLQTQLSDTRNKMEQLQAELMNCQAHLSAKDSEISSAAAHLDQTTAEFKNLMEENNQAKVHICDLTDQLNAYRTEKDSIEARLADLEKENCHLQQERDAKGDVAEKELQTSMEKKEKIEQQLKNVNADLKAKNKTLKELEKEVKSLRGKLTTQERKQEEKSREVEYLKQELLAGEQAKEHSEKLITSLQSHLEQETEKARHNAQQVEQLQRDTAQVQKEKNDSMMLCDHQIIEMTATLQKYTNDHQKFLALKDKEINELRSKNAQLTTCSEQNKSSAKELREESQYLQQQILTLRTTMEQLEKKKAVEIEILQEQLKEQTNLEEDRNQNCRVVQPATCMSHSMEVDNPPAPPSVPTPLVAQNQNQPMAKKQRSILRRAGTINKRRRVAFTSAAFNTSDSDSPVDLELEDVITAQSKPSPRQPLSKPSPRQPLRFRHSPHKNRSVVSTPVVLTPSKDGFILESTGKNAKLMQSIASVQSKSPEAFQIKENEFSKTPNVRKAPMRTSRFFRASPKERKIQKKQEEDKEELAWFDQDRVYAFGFED